MPWDAVIRASADDKAWWDDHFDKMCLVAQSKGKVGVPALRIPQVTTALGPLPVMPTGGKGTAAAAGHAGQAPPPPQPQPGWRTDNQGGEWKKKKLSTRDAAYCNQVVPAA